MSRCCWWGLALLLLSGLMNSTAEAQQFGMNYSPRALCVTDPYGAQFHSWQGSPIAFNSYFYTQFGGTNSSFSGGTTTGYFGGGVPAVASANTPEWIVQRTSVFPIGTYSPWAEYPGAYVAPWRPHLGMQRTPPSQQPLDERDTHIRQTSGSRPIRDDRGAQALAEGDRLLRDGQNAQAYLRYLEAQRDLGSEGEIYFRQTFALVALGRHSHAVAKLKRGLQVEPNYPRRGVTLDEVFGVENKDQKDEHLQQVTRWTEANPRNPDRLILLGAMMHFDGNPRANDVLNAAGQIGGAWSPDGSSNGR